MHPLIDHRQTMGQNWTHVTLSAMIRFGRARPRGCYNHGVAKCVSPALPPTTSYEKL
jgi:hypothetical protein